MQKCEHLLQFLGCRASSVAIRQCRVRRDAHEYLALPSQLQMSTSLEASRRSEKTVSRVPKDVSHRSTSKQEVKKLRPPGTTKLQIFSTQRACTTSILPYPSSISTKIYLSTTSTASPQSGSYSAPTMRNLARPSSTQRCSNPPSRSCNRCRICRVSIFYSRTSVGATTSFSRLTRKATTPTTIPSSTTIGRDS